MQSIIIVHLPFKCLAMLIYSTDCLTITDFTATGLNTTSDDEQYCPDNRYHYHSQSLLFAVYYQILLISIIIIATQCNDIHCINTLVRQSLLSYSFRPRNLSKVLSACCPCREYDLICSRKENRIWIIIFRIY